MPAGLTSSDAGRTRGLARDPAVLLFIPRPAVDLGVLLVVGGLAAAYLLALLYGTLPPPLPLVFRLFGFLSYVTALSAYVLLWAGLVRSAPRGNRPYARPPLWGILAAGVFAGLCGAAAAAMLGSIQVPQSEFHVFPGWAGRAIEGLCFSALHAGVCFIVARRHA